MTERELMDKISSLEARIRMVEDIEEIKNLMAAYTVYLDSLQRMDELLALFTEDAKFSVSSSGDAGAEKALMGTFEGKEALRALFAQGASTAHYVYMAHHVTNPLIAVDGEKATGKWYLLSPFTALTPQGPRAVWEQGTYDNDYVKVDGKWKIKFMRFQFNFSTPYEDGWVKTRMRGA